MEFPLPISRFFSMLSRSASSSDCTISSDKSLDEGHFDVPEDDVDVLWVPVNEISTKTKCRIPKEKDIVAHIMT